MWAYIFMCDYVSECVTIWNKYEHVHVKKKNHMKNLHKNKWKNNNQINE